ncbi:MAG TPA: PEP-CTERM sorting domain-containing protein [Bryobacteraceae bacterium]|nr:PEP-CTERM sorting domain-containing protein [Bryobacteraceae bacterium]
MKLTHLCVATSLILFVIDAQAVAGPILNGGFETGSLTPWFQGVNGSAGFYTGSPWTVSSAAAHSGLYGAVADGNQQIRQNFSGVLGAEITEFSFWIRRPNAIPIAPANQWVLATFYYADSTQGWAFTPLTSSDWTHIDFTANINDAKTLTGFDTWGYVQGPTPNVLTYVDDFRLTLTTDTVPEPRSITLLGGGLLGLMLLRRVASKRT